MSVSRRKWMSAATAAGISTLAPPARAASQKPLKSKTFVLVHGAWHGGWCWRDVRMVLEVLGHRVYTPTLTGLGDRSHLLSADVSLQTHITDIGHLLAFEDLQDVILVGHSYAGMIITAIADQMPEKLAHVCYLDAALPHDGDSLMTHAGSVQTDDLEGAAALSVRDDGYSLDIPTLDILGIPADHPNAEWVRTRLTPHPVRTLSDVIHLPNRGLDKVRKTYVLCNDPIFAGGGFLYHHNRLQGHADWHTAALNTGHDAMVTAPVETAELLDSLSV